MRKFWFLGLIGLLVLTACGSSATAVPAAPAAAAQPAVPAAPAAVAAPVATAAPAAPAVKSAPGAVTLADVAAKLAGKPGAIFVGDLKQLAGPAPTKEMGDFDGNVPLDSLQRHLFFYNSDYYRGLLEKAKLTNPTPLVSTGQKFEIQHVCVNRSLLFCKLDEFYFAPNLLARTNGQVKIVMSSQPELGLAGTDTQRLLSDGTLAMATYVGSHNAGDLPALEVQNLWGIYPDREAEFKSRVAVAPYLNKLVEEATGGAKFIQHVWVPADIYFFSKKALRTPADFKGLKTRSAGPAMTDWAIGMGAEGVFMPFAEIYTALERGILDAGLTGPDPAFGQRWYEVTSYISGGTTLNMDMLFDMVNKKVWEKLPPDLQAIMIEEGAKNELEALRLVSIQNEIGLLKNIGVGMKLVEFSPELRALSDAAVLQRVVPNWVKRVGGPDKPIIKVFNESVGPLVGLRIEANGALTKLGGQKAPAAAPAAAAVAAPPSGLAAYAAKYAGKPGAIYVGDIKQLVGPAPSKDEGDFDGNVPLDSLQRHQFLYDSDFYKGLLAKAKLTNPTPLVSSGQSITIQHACINRALLFCKLVESYFAPNLLARTKGQLKLTISSFPELGVAGPDTLRLVSDGTLAMGELIGPYLGGDLPAIEIQDLFGIFPDQETNYRVIFALAPDMEKLMVEATGGGKVIHHGWVSGNNVYFFSKKALRTPDDWKGVKFRVPSTATSDWLGGMGASAQFMAFSEVYTAMERGILDGAMSGADAGYGQRWYEVTKYMNGPLLNRQRFAHVINKDVWSKLPPDLQAIMIEEGAKSELEGLRLAAIQNEMSLVRLGKAGMEVVEFSPEVRARSNAVVLERVVTNWVKRIGGPDKPFAKLFNEKVGPLVGVRIEPNGSVVKVPITK